MSTRVAHPATRRLAERFCPRCGYRGPELQGPRGVSVFVCASCGEDLYTRPARSYFEMEGLVDERTEIIEFVAQANPRASAKPPARRRRFWTHRRMRRVIVGAMLAVASAGFFLVVSLATVAVLSS